MYGNSFYNPYMYNNIRFNNASSFGKIGLFGGLFKKFNLSSFLTGANKTLNVVNQAIPIYYQIKPMVANAKTMFKVINAVKNTDNNKTNSTITKTETKKESKNINDGSPTFFI